MKLPVGIMVLCFFSLTPLYRNRKPVRICFLTDVLQEQRIELPRMSSQPIPANSETIADWMVTLGGMHFNNWQETPNLRSHLLSLGEIAFRHRRIYENLQMNIDAGYELGVLVTNPFRIEKSSDNLSMNMTCGIKAFPFSMSLLARMNTQLFPGYIEHPDDSIRIKNSSFLSPSSAMLSYGYTYSTRKKIDARIEMGLCGARSRIFINQRIYALLQREEMNGVARGEYISSAYGISLRYEISHDFNKSIHWKNEGLFSVTDPYGSYNDFWNRTDFEIRNTILLKAGKRIKTKIESILRYDPILSESLQIRHAISVGFSE